MKILFNKNKDKSKKIKNRSSAIIFYLYFIIFTASGCAQQYEDLNDQICNSKFNLALDKNLSHKPINEVIVEIGKSFIGTDYRAHTLEVNTAEKLVINLSELDCNTFVENVLAISRCIKKNKAAFDAFENELTLIRYRDGKINEYPSRLHYFTDWIYNNEEKGIVKNVTKKIGGEKLEINLSFMSSHPEYYKHLKENPEFIPIISEQESEISNREHYFIPKENVQEIEKEIESGDLLVFTSNIKGLDVNHVGISLRMDDNKIHILHAPSVGYKIQITELPLAEYVNQIEKDSGVIVVRALEPTE